MTEMYLPAREVRLNGKKASVATYPVNSLVIGRDWPGWEGLSDYHPALLDGTTAVQLIKGGAGEEASATARILRAVPDGVASVQPVHAEVFSTNVKQRADKAGDSSIVISEAVRARLPEAEHYRVVCPFTRCSFVVTRDEIETFPEGEYSEGTIKISRYQRILLRLHPPMDITKAHRDAIPPEHHTLIDTHYKDRGVWPRERIDDIAYPDRIQLNRALRAAKFFDIMVVPMIEGEGTSVFGDNERSTARKNPLRRSWYWTARKLLGSRTYVMRVARPNDIDESRAVVRLTADSMQSLGIEDSDIVRLRYGDRTIAARAMAIVDDARFRQNSHISVIEPLDAVIGIPSKLRGQLGVPSINESVKVDRDVNHLLRKTLNVYILSALAWLFTVLQVIPEGPRATIGTVGLFVLALPFIVYLAAAPRRAQVMDAS